VFFIGFAAITAVPGLTGPDADLALLRVTRLSYGPWVMGLVGAAGLLTALVPGSLILMSTATILSRLITSSTRTDARGEVRIAQLMVPFVAAVALFFVYRGGQTIVTLLLFAYAIVTQLFPAVLLSLLWPHRTNAMGAAAGMVAGLGVVAYTTMAGVTLATMLPSVSTHITDINIGVLALLVNVAVLALFTLAKREARPTS
jgi:SSS family solute:Na+ symporter